MSSIKQVALLCLSSCLFLAPAAHALPSDKNEPIYISADKASMNEQTGITVYTGRVEIRQGSMLLLGDRVELRRASDGEIERIISTGNPAEFHQQHREGQPLTKAYGQNMNYHVTQQQVTITNQARVVQGNDNFTGERIVYNMDQAVVDAFGSESGGQRVEMVIQPRSSGN